MKNRCFKIDFGGHCYKIATVSRQRGPDTLLLLHGLGCSKASFRDIWNCNELRDCSIVALDLIGFGESSNSDSFSYELEDHAAVCAQVFQDFPAQRIHIVAHSMGGAIGLLLPPGLLNSARSFANLEGNLSSAERGVVSRMTTAVSFPTFEQQVWPEIKALSDSMGSGRFFLDSASPAAFYRSAVSLARWSHSGKLLKRFSRLTCKNAYFYGEHNAAGLALDRLAQTQTIRIGDSGHFMMNDNPDEFYHRLARFLKAA